MHNTKVLLVIFVIFALLATGCSISPEQLVTANPIVKDFLKQYPNAEVKITFFSNVESEKIIDSIKEDCGKDSLQAKNYYKVTIEDPESGLFILSWLDWDSKIVECVQKKYQIKNENDKESGKGVMPVIEPSKPTQTESKTEENAQETTSTEATLPVQSIPDTSTESEEKQCITSCDDGNKCTFDYCNSYTEFECKHKLIEPCFNDGVCEEEETSLSSAPSCPNLGWVAAGKASRAVSSESQAEKGYYAYKSSINSGQNSDCPITCDDGNPSTSDYFDFKEQTCKHYSCYRDTSPPKITVIEPKQNSIITNQNFPLIFKTDKDAICQHSFTPYNSYINTTKDIEYSTTVTDQYQTGHILLTCKDKNGNSNKENIYYTIDLNPPTILSTYPYGNNYILSDTLLELTAKTKIEAACSFKGSVISGALAQDFGPTAMETINGKEHSYKLNLLDNSTYNIDISCKYNNMINTVSMSFKVDTSYEAIVYPTS